MAALADLQNKVRASSPSYGGGGGGGASDVNHRVSSVALREIKSCATTESSSSSSDGRVVASGGGTTVTKTTKAANEESDDDWEIVSKKDLNPGGEDRKLMYAVLGGGVELYWQAQPLRTPAGVQWNKLETGLQRIGLTPREIAFRRSFMHPEAFAQASTAARQTMQDKGYALLCNLKQIPKDLKKPVKIVMNQDGIQASGRLFFFSTSSWQRGYRVYCIDVEQKTMFSTPVTYEMKTTPKPTFCGTVVAGVFKWDGCF